MSKSSFSFLGYRIPKVELNILDDFEGIKELTQEVEIENHYSVDDKDLVEVQLNINISNKAKTLTMSLVIKGGFRRDKTMEDGMFKLLASQNGPAILFPYARAIVSTYTAQANIQPIILGTVDFTKTKEVEKAETGPEPETE